MTPREIHDHAERYRMFRDKRWRQGYCAGLTTAHGRQTMIQVRELGESRDRGKRDVLYAVYWAEDTLRDSSRRCGAVLQAIFQQG